MMLLQQENDPIDTSYHAHVHAPVGAHSAVHAEQPVLALHIGYHQDPGIRRKYRPNEDTLFVMHGVMPFASSPSTPFVLLVADGIIAPDDIYTHPRRNVIYRSLGVEATIEVDTFTVPLAAGDTLLMCSDGLWEMVRDRPIAAILTAPMPAPSDTAHALIQAALTGGGEDNVSAIVARVSKA